MSVNALQGTDDEKSRTGESNEKGAGAMVTLVLVLVVVVGVFVGYRRLNKNVNQLTSDGIVDSIYADVHTLVDRRIDGQYVPAPNALNVVQDVVDNANYRDPQNREYCAAAIEDDPAAAGGVTILRDANLVEIKACSGATTAVLPAGCCSNAAAVTTLRKRRYDIVMWRASAPAEWVLTSARSQSDRNTAASGAAGNLTAGGGLAGPGVFFNTAFSSTNGSFTGGAAGGGAGSGSGSGGSGSGSGGAIVGSGGMCHGVGCPSGIGSGGGSGSGSGSHCVGVACFSGGGAGSATGTFGGSGIGTSYSGTSIAGLPGSGSGNSGMGSGSGNPGGSGPGGLGIPSISGTGPSSLDGDLGNPGGGLGSNHSFSGAQVLLGDDQGLNGSHNATSSQITLHVRPSMCMLRPRGLVGAQ